MDAKVPIRLAVIDCGVRQSNLPAPMPKDIRDDLQRVLANEAKNSARISQFYRRQLRSIAPKGVELSVSIYPLEQIRNLPKHAFEALVITDSYYTPTRELQESNEHVQRLLEVIRNAHDSGKSTLGICFGHEAIGAAFGIYPASFGMRIIGYKQVEVVGQDPILSDFPRRFAAIFNHRYWLEKPPEGAVVLAKRESFERMVASGWGEAHTVSNSR